MYDAVMLIATVLCGILAALNLVQLFTGQTPTPDEGRASILSVLGKMLNRFFSLIGTIAILVVVGEVLFVTFLAPKWNLIDRFQERLALGIAAKIAPSIAPRIADAGDRSVDGSKPSGNFAPFKTPYFTVQLSPATRTIDNISVKATVLNTTSEPLFLALNNSQRPSLTDDKFGFTSDYRRHSGINWATIDMNGREKEERSYTQILPYQRLDIGFEFYAYKRGTPETESTIHTTIDFIALHKNKVDRISAAPGAPMRFQ